MEPVSARTDDAGLGGGTKLLALPIALTAGAVKGAAGGKSAMIVGVFSGASPIGLSSASRACCSASAALAGRLAISASTLGRGAPKCAESGAVNSSSPVLNMASSPVRNV